MCRFENFRSVALLAAGQHFKDRELDENAEKIDRQVRKIVENAENFGGSVGMAFQLVDDYLDFAATADQV